MFRPSPPPAMGTPYRQPWKGVLMAKGKSIQVVECLHSPFELPEELHLEDRMKECLIFDPANLAQFTVKPLGTTVSLVYKWLEFLRFLLDNAKVAMVVLKDWELFIPPPNATPLASTCLTVYYRPKPVPVVNMMKPRKSAADTPGLVCTEHASQGPQGNLSSIPHSGTHVHPSHLETLEQMHAAWAFGAVAELIDNARDAKATCLDISIKDMVLDAGEIMPVLQVIDNGQGMNHADIVKMLSFGHKRPKECDTDQIGHFGVGFKTGAMRLGRDAVILTKSKETCSMGFLSKSYNANLEDLEIPIVTYKRFTNGQIALDESVCTKEDEEKCKKAIAKHSPFKNDLSIGAQFAKIEKTGTNIFVYNLEQWDGNCIAEWSENKTIKSEEMAKEKELPGDIKIPSRRLRVRAGQTSQQVPLDYSLRAYAEVLFLVPSMKISLQGTPVTSRNLVRDFKDLQVFEYPFIHEKDPKKNKLIPLTLGKREVEYNHGNCGIFLYWHGRLIEAYKRVGPMVHSADIGRGIIGVMDITDIMDFGKGKVGVLNNKQGFTDSDRFCKLEKWLEETFGTYWDDRFDKFGLFKKGDLKKGEKIHVDDRNDWVQCVKCEKWRELPPGVSPDDLVGDWFCYMKPFEGNCGIPEAKQDDVVTLAINRDGIKKVASVALANASNISGSANSSADIGAPELIQRLKRLKKGTKNVKTDLKRQKGLNAVRC